MASSQRTWSLAQHRQKTQQYIQYAFQPTSKIANIWQTTWQTNPAKCKWWQTSTCTMTVVGLFAKHKNLATQWLELGPIGLATLSRSAHKVCKALEEMCHNAPKPTTCTNQKSEIQYKSIVFQCVFIFQHWLLPVLRNPCRKYASVVPASLKPL